MPEKGGKNRVYTKYRSNNGALRAIRSAVTIITKQFRFYIMLLFFFFLWLRNNFSPNLFLLEIYFIFFRIFSRYASKKKNAINYRFYTNDLHRRFNLSNLDFLRENLSRLPRTILISFRSCETFDQHARKVIALIGTRKDVRCRVHSQLCGRHIPYIRPFARRL